MRLPTTCTRWSSPSALPAIPFARTTRSYCPSAARTAASTATASAISGNGTVCTSCASNSEGVAVAAGPSGRRPPRERKRPAATALPAGSKTGVSGASSARRRRAASTTCGSTMSVLDSMRRSALPIWLSIASRAGPSSCSAPTWSAATTTTTPSRINPAELPHAVMRSGSATPLSSTTTWSGGTSRARSWSNAAPKPSIRLQQTQPSVSSIVSPCWRAIRAASMLISPTSLTRTAIGRSVTASNSLIAVVLPAPR